MDLPTAGDPSLAWFVREAWPSPASFTEHTQGWLGAQDRLTITAESDALVVFGDGIESDRLVLDWGQEITVAVAPQALRLVLAA